VVHFRHTEFGALGRERHIRPCGQSATNARRLTANLGDHGDGDIAQDIIEIEHRIGDLSLQLERGLAGAQWGHGCATALVKISAIPVEQDRARPRIKISQRGCNVGRHFR